MSGVAIISDQLRNSAPLTARVAPANIKGGLLPDDAPLPAIVMRSISIVDRQTLAREEMVRVTERVSVTVRAGSYRDRNAIIKLVRSACSGAVIPAFDACRNIAVLTAGAGPELNGPSNTFERSQDFTVTYDEPA